MRLYLLYLIALIATLPAFAQDQGTDRIADTPDREALLRAAVSRDRGEITAMEPLPREGQGVIVGYSSGAVLNCHGESSCREFGGTPNAAVGHLAVSKDGASEVIWVAYPHGALYRCSLSRCDKFLWDVSRQP